MGYYPYEQECIHGHKWGAAFCSVEPMSDSGQKRCPECGCYKVRTVWYIGQEGQCFMRHTKEDWEKEKRGIKPGTLEWENPEENDPAPS